MRIASIGLLLVASLAHAEVAPCAGRSAQLLVLSASHQLMLCEGGRAVATYPVVLGRGGLGKQRSGDNKTPIGTYALGRPRTSREYGMFIPVGYPTMEQRRRGHTGGDIGVHGPRRNMRWLGKANGWIDWTRGCVAVPTDEDIAKVASWVGRRPGATIAIE